VGWKYGYLRRSLFDVFGLLGRSIVRESVDILGDRCSHSAGVF